MEQPPKNLIAQLFCKDNWEKFENRVIFNSLETQKAELPTHNYRRWYCKKCGKLKELKMF